MNWILDNLWLIPLSPLLAAAAISVMPKAFKTVSASLAIGAMAVAFILSAKAFLVCSAVVPNGSAWHWTHNFEWFQFGQASLRLGWVLDPLTAVMLAMVTFVSLLIFIFSIGYMAHDENFTRFFCFLSLFAAAMLGLIIANNLLMLFMCWEVVGLASYLLIGFWYHKPSAAAASKKAFITTRVGDVVFFLGILFLYWQAGTLLFYDGSKGFLEAPVLRELAGRTTAGGLAVTTAIGLLIFCGAIGKSGQFPLHVWLPDAMEGPTPVSALIHAATMVAAGVFLVARIFPLLNPLVVGVSGVAGFTQALTVVTWVGAVTAVFAACIAVAQNDIKRILAYSTVSQLGFMMMGLGMGGVAVGMFHLITHAFFKALLFLGSGSVIHGCHEEQDIRRMGGLRKWMPITFITYGIGMMALSGVPLFFSGFWSKDGILHAAKEWKGFGSNVPFYLGAFAALLTAFYMTRQMIYVFFGTNRAAATATHSHAPSKSENPHASEPHESPAVMTIPLCLLAVFAVGLGFIGTPAWPWFQSFLDGKVTDYQPSELFSAEIRPVLILSSLITLAGITLGWWVYGRNPITNPSAKDALETRSPDIFALLSNKFFVDEFYEGTAIRFNAWWSEFCDLMDYWVWNGVVMAVSYAIIGVSWASRFLDEYGINLGFSKSCEKLNSGGGLISKFQDGQSQKYLRVIGVALAVLGLLMLWGCKAS